MSNITMSVGGPWDLAPNYNVGDFFPNGVYPMIPWTNPFDGIKPWASVERNPYEVYYIQTIFTGGQTVNNKEKEKLAQIKGLIEGFRILVDVAGSEEATMDGDPLLDKILKVIEE